MSFVVQWSHGKAVYPELEDAIINASTLLENGFINVIISKWSNNYEKPFLSNLLINHPDCQN